MRVSRVELRGVTTHRTTDLEIPDTGVVLVTGPNGAGKSSILDAVPLVLWGRTLRGKPVWSGPSSLVAVTVDGTRYARTQRGQSSKLTWPGAPTYESTKHALDALRDIVGPMSSWVGSCVLSSTDAARFTAATDTERKTVLEEILQLHRYDRACETLRGQAKSARAALDAATRAHARATERHTRAASRLAETQATPVVPPHPVHPGPPPITEDHTAELAALDRELSQIRQATQAAQATERAAADRLAVLRESARRLAAGQCGSCGQPIPQDLRDSVAGELATATAALDAAQEALAATRSQAHQVTSRQRELHDRTRGTQDALRRHTVACGAYQRELEHHRATLALVEQLDAQRSAAHQEHQAAQAELAAAHAELEHARSELAHLDVATAITGPQGYRATQLAGSLQALEEYANGWLTMLDTQLRLEIRAGGTRADGSPTARVTLGVRGAGGGHYQGCSGGERRRIDVAVMLGLAQLADTGRQAPPSTLWADECFDALDQDGREALAGLLAGLSSDRAVVVVTHTAQEEIASVARVRYVVLGGQVHRG